MGGGASGRASGRERQGSSGKLTALLRWSLDDGATFRALVEAKASIPDELEPPELLPGLRAWYDLFWELSTDRQIGMAAGPIPASSIARETAGWPDEDAEAFRIAMREMDGVWLDHTRRGRDGASDRDMTGSNNPARDAFRAAFR